MITINITQGRPQVGVAALRELYTLIISAHVLSMRLWRLFLCITGIVHGMSDNPISGPVNISIDRSIVFNISSQVVDRSAASRSEMKPLKRSIFSLISARTRKWQRAHATSVLSARAGSSRLRNAVLIINHTWPGLVWRRSRMPFLLHSLNNQSAFGVDVPPSTNLSSIISEQSQIQCFFPARPLGPPRCITEVQSSWAD